MKRACIDTFLENSVKVQVCIAVKLVWFFLTVFFGQNDLYERSGTKLEGGCNNI